MFAVAQESTIALDQPLFTLEALSVFISFHEIFEHNETIFYRFFLSLKNIIEIYLFHFVTFLTLPYLQLQ